MTELACGVDLVRAQLRVARGAKLSELGDLGTLWPQSAVKADKWALQCRVSLLPPTKPEHGGELCVLDEPNGCWHALPPREDTLLVFNSVKVLHQVKPSYAESRLALTAFFTVARNNLDRLKATARNPERYEFAGEAVGIS